MSLGIQRISFKDKLLEIFDKLQQKATLNFAFRAYEQLIASYISSQRITGNILTKTLQLISQTELKFKPSSYKLLPCFLGRLQGSPSSSNYLSSVLKFLNNNLVKDTYDLTVATFIDIINVGSCEIDTNEGALNINIMYNFCLKVKKVFSPESFLIKLVEGTKIIQIDNYYYDILDKVIFVGEDTVELSKDKINLLLRIILIKETDFSPYAKLALSYVVNEMTNPDDDTRKGVLNIIYSLLCLCRDQIYPVDNSIIVVLKNLKGDKNKTVRQIVIMILDLINGKSKVKKVKSLKPQCSFRSSSVCSFKRGNLNRSCSDLNSSISTAVLSSTTRRELYSSGLNTSKALNHSTSYAKIHNEKAIKLKNSSILEKTKDILTERSPKKEKGYQIGLKKQIPLEESLSMSTLSPKSSVHSLLSLEQNKVRRRNSSSNKKRPSSRPQSRKASPKKKIESSPGIEDELVMLMSKESPAELIQKCQVVSLQELEKVESRVLEDLLMRVVSLLLVTQSNCLISFIKKSLIGLNCELKKSTINNICEIFTYIKMNSKSLSENDFVDINLIIELLKNKY